MLKIHLCLKLSINMFQFYFFLSRLGGVAFDFILHTFVKLHLVSFCIFSFRALKSITLASRGTFT